MEMNNNKTNKLSETRSAFEKYKEHSSLPIFKRSSTQKPFITVAIPTYQRPNLLRDAIQSALDQEIATCYYDIIVVDNDDSTNGSNETENIVREFHTDKISYYRNSKNLGMFGNWNRCFELAEGDWIALLHDDDALMPNYIKVVSNLLKRKKNIGAICANLRLMGSEDVMNGKQPASLVKNWILSKRLRRIYCMESDLWNADIYSAPTCGALFNKEKVLQSYGFDETLFPSADWFFMYFYNTQYPVFKPLVPTGYYRVSVNESLKTETMIKFIEDAGIFRNYSKDRSIVRKIINNFFGIEQHMHQVDTYISFLEKEGYKNTDFNYVEDYKRRPVRNAVFTAVKRLYLKLSKITALIFG